MPNWEASKEYDKRRNREILHQQQQQQQQQQQMNQPFSNNRAPHHQPFPPHINGPGLPNPPFHRPNNGFPPAPHPPYGGPRNYQSRPPHNQRDDRPPGGQDRGLPPAMGFKGPGRQNGPPHQNHLQPLHWTSNGNGPPGGGGGGGGPRSLPQPPVGLPQPVYGGSGGYSGPLNRGGKNPERAYTSGSGYNKGSNVNGPPHGRSVGGPDGLPYD